MNTKFILEMAGFAGLVGILGGVLILIMGWVDVKFTGNDKVSNTLMSLENLVIKVVVATNQTFVDTLKGQGNFDEAAQKKAFDQAKTKILSMITDSCKSIIKKKYGDVDLYIESLIEYYVSNYKSIGTHSIESCLGELISNNDTQVVKESVTPTIDGTNMTLLSATPRDGSKMVTLTDDSIVPNMTD